MKKFRIVSTVAVAGFVALGLGAGSASASSPSIVDVDGTCFETGPDGMPRRVPCPPDADTFEGVGTIDPFAGMCWEDQMGGIRLPVPCPEDDTSSEEFPEICFEMQGGFLMIVPCPEIQFVIPTPPAIDTLPEFSDSDSDVGAEDTDVEEVPAEEDSVDDGSEPLGEVDEVLAGDEVTNDDDEEPVMAAAPTDIDDQTDQSYVEFVELSVETARSADVVETVSVQPEITVPEAQSEQNSLGLLAGIMLVLLGGGGLAAVGVVVARKRD